MRPNRSSSLFSSITAPMFALSFWLFKVNSPPKHPEQLYGHTQTHGRWDRCPLSTPSQQTCVCVCVRALQRLKSGSGKRRHPRFQSCCWKSETEMLKIKSKRTENRGTHPPVFNNMAKKEKNTIHHPPSSSFWNEEVDGFSETRVNNRREHRQDFTDNYSKLKDHTRNHTIKQAMAA